MGTGTARRGAFFSLLLSLIFLAAPAIASGQTVFTRTLAIGSYGPDVTALQEFLLQKGLFNYTMATGYFGPITSEGVAAFQKEQGLPPVGVVGPKTLALLGAAGSSIGIGATGADVVALQTFLKQEGYFNYPDITGYFGPITSAALSAFQKATDLPATGVDDAATQAVIAGAAGATTPTSVQQSSGSCDAPPGLSCIPGTSIIQPVTSGGSSPGFGGGGGSTSSNNTPTPDTTPPTVSLTAPSNSATVSGSSVTISANASDDTSVAGVQFKLDTNTNIGAEETSAPYSITWDTTAVAEGTHTIVAVARDGSGNYATSSAITVTVDNWDAGPVNSQSYTFASTRLQLPTSSAIPTSGQEIMTSSVGAGTPAYPTTNPRFFFPSFYAVTSGGDDTPLENSFTILGASVKVGSTWYPLYFNGSPGTTIDPSTSVGIWSDPATTTGTIPANSIVQIRTAFKVNSGQKMLTGMIIGASTWASTVTEGQGFFATDALAIAKLTDNLSVGTNGRVSGFMYGPAGMVAQGWDGRAVVLVTGDSIGRGIASSMTFANARGDYGYIDTGLDDASSSTRLPFWNITAPGTNPGTGAVGWGNRANFHERLDAIKLLPNRPFTIVVDEHGSNSTNDNGGVDSQYTNGLRASEIEMSTMLRAEYGNSVSMYQTTITPKVQSSTDRFSSLAGQTVTGGSLDSTTTLVGGALWQFNNELVTGYSSVFGYNGYIDVWDAVSYDTGANRQYWAVPSFTATVSSNYATTSSSIVLSAAPAVGELLVFDPGNTNGIANAVSVSGTGPYTVSLSAHLSVAYTTGTAVGATYTSDGTHPSPTAHALLAAKLIAWKNSLGL